MVNPNEIDVGEWKLRDIRSIRRNESSGFTPWLSDSEHVARRSAVLGIELELENLWLGLPATGWRKRK